jgi:large subunit ribosomal protein L25
MKIKASLRDTTGKKVKNIRAEGNLPASVYGPKRESTNIKLDPIEFRKAYKEVGYNQLLDVDIEGEKDTVKVLVKEVQKNPIMDEIYHVSLYQIDMDKKIVVDIPVRSEGVSPAVKSNIGFLVQRYESLPVLCLPQDIPDMITVNIEGLEDINDSIQISELTLPDKVEWAPNLSELTVIFRITPPQKEIEEEEDLTPDEVEVIGEKEEGELEEGEAPEGEESEESESAEEAKKEE